MNSTDIKPKSKAEREAEEKAKRRAEEATIVAGLKQAIDADEQLLGFTRGRVAGGIRGKMSLGPEAFFAPFVNIGLTERRIVVQHINSETGRPGEILPHFYALGDIAALTFSDIETFGADAAARLTLRLRNDQHTRLRLRGLGNFENAKAIVEVFQSLMSAQRSVTTPTQRVCGTCRHILDQPFKFCPYCGQLQDLNAAPTTPASTVAAEPEPTYPTTPPGATKPEFMDTVPYKEDGILGGPTLEDGLDLLTPNPVPQPKESVVEPDPVADPDPVAEPESVATPAPEAAVGHEPEAVAVPDPEAIAAEPFPPDAALETPSTFEGWSVDPGAGPAVVEPTQADAETPPIMGVTSNVSAAADVIETEASVAETPPGAMVSTAEPAHPPEIPTDVHTMRESLLPTVHPEAAFAPIPEPIAFTPEAALAPTAFESAPREAGQAPQTDPTPTPFVSPAADRRWTPAPIEASQEAEFAPVIEGHFAPTVEAQAPPTSASYAHDAPTPTDVLGKTMAAEPILSTPPHEAAGFVMDPPAADTPTPVSYDFKTHAPVVPPLPAPDASASPEPLSRPVPDAESTLPAVAPDADRFAALLREVRGGDASVEPTPAPIASERKDGPMSVAVHINRPPLVVKETFTGRNADEVVGKLKARVSSEVNFALRMMLNSFNNLRFAQEVVRRYNDQEKTHYPLPNSCWEFLLNAEEIKYVTISLD